MLRWFRRWLGLDQEPFVEVVGGLSDPEAEMWADVLRKEGVAVVIKSYSPLLGDAGARSFFDYALNVRVGDIDRARELLAPLFKTHAPSRLPRR